MKFDKKKEERRVLTLVYAAHVEKKEKWGNREREINAKAPDI